MDTTRLHHRRREAQPVLGMTLLDAEVWGAPGSPASFSNTAYTTLMPLMANVWMARCRDVVALRRVRPLH
jgi:hypothetical protein